MSDSDPDRLLGPSAEIDEAYCAACNQSFTLDAEFCPNDGARLIKLKARPDTLIGRVFEGRYEVRAPLGHGGMGTVYRGWQLSVDREIAIKVIHPKLSGDRASAKRFLREARLASRLGQANVVSVYEFGQTEDGILYIAMELLRGRPLSKDLAAMRPLSMKRIKTISLQICDGLDAAHAQGIIHRDLKPGNIIILDDPPGRDVIKILDFGLAKSLQDDTSLVTRTDAILGTPLYMPPEQILGKDSDQTADLYSLGCILYQLATGRPPYVGENINVVLGSHVDDPVPEVGDHVPADLAAVITRLMQKEPRARYQSAREVRAALEALGDDPDSRLTARAAVPAGLGVRSDVIRSVVAPSAVGLAATAETSVPAPTIPVRAPAATPPPAPRSSRRSLVLLLGLCAIGGGALIGLVISRQPATSSARDAALDPLESAPDATAASVDAAPVLAPLDAALAIDAAAPETLDRPVDHPRIDAGVPRPRPDAATSRPPRDAGVRAMPDASAARSSPDAATIELVRDAGAAPRPDAKIDIDIIGPGGAPIRPEKK